MASPRAQRIQDAGPICVYCGEPRLDGAQTPEHPIPRALGSSITVYTVCGGCNQRAGREVDRPWINEPLVLAARSRSGLRDRGRPVRDPILDGVGRDEDGHVVVAEKGVPRYPGSIVWDGDQITIAAGTSERAAELLSRVKRDLAAEGSTVEGYTEERRSVRPQITKRLEASTSTGVRMGCKIALALAGEAFDHAWRSRGGESATRLALE